MTRIPHSRLVFRLGGAAVWIGLVLAGFGLLVRHATRPGASAACARWPADAPLVLDPARPTLLLFAHPRCPCTRASLAELERLATRLGGRARLRVLVHDDPAAGLFGDRGELVAAAGRIPGVDLARDPCGTVAALFGAETSGQTLLFAPDGRLLFSGGLTAERACEGPNDGATAILACLDRPAGATLRTPVFGCPLRTPDPEVAP